MYQLALVGVCANRLPVQVTITENRNVSVSGSVTVDQAQLAVNRIECGNRTYRNTLHPGLCSAHSQTYGSVQVGVLTHHWTIQETPSLPVARRLLNAKVDDGLKTNKTELSICVWNILRRFT